MRFPARLILNLLIYTALVLSLNLAVEKTSIGSFGHLGFFGVGIILAATLLERGSSLVFFLGLFSAMLDGVILGLAIGFTTIKMRQDYFLLLSIFIVEVRKL